tara:strand:- start:772 stop:1767 length:996 start_codon:yes stop_codon:yes gene_type:complete
MIIKTFELQKLSTIKINIFLLYGDNEGLKNQIIKDYFIDNCKDKIERFEEIEILNNFESFLSSLMNKSFFEDKKLIIVSRTSEKIIKLVEEILSKNLNDIKLILNSSSLEKKSKLRTFFEKEKNLACIPFYSDDLKILNSIANIFFKKNNISISQEAINLIIDRCSGDRQNLNNELEKISFFMKGKKKITSEEIIKLTNLAENFSISELTDNCLSRNLKKTIKILNESNYSIDDCILIIRTLLLKSKRLLKLKKEYEKNKNIDLTISSYKPPIFWKDKEIVKNQILNWSLTDAEKLIYEINDIELLVKKNSFNSLNILSDFILKKTNHINN